MASQEDFERILKLLTAAKPSCGANLIAAFNMADTTLMTAEGSENFLMWSDLTNLGWMEEVATNIPQHLAEKTPVRSVGFRITEAGRPEIEKLLKVMGRLQQVKKTSSLVVKNPKIGFLGFDPSTKDLVEEDSKVLGPLFSLCQTGPDYKTPCHVLFIYGKIRPDGIIEGTLHHVRDVATRYRAYIVVLASDNNPDITMHGFPWKIRSHWGVNFIYTGNRNGKFFAEFFHHIFKSMHEGKFFGVAWVELSPQGNVPPNPNAPGCMMVQEFGNLLFKREEQTAIKIGQDVIEEAALAFQKDGQWHKSVADEVLKTVMVIDTGNDRSHLETLFSRLGAFAGFASMGAMRAAVAGGRIKIAPEDKTAIRRLNSKDGSGAYFVGDLIQQPVAAAPISLTSLMFGVVKETDAPPPDMSAIFQGINTSLGHKGYGTFDTGVPDQHWPKELPIETIKKYSTPIMRPIYARKDDPIYAGWYFALAAQKLIRENKDRLSPTIAAQIFLEAAIVMSYLDPSVIYPPNPAA